MSCVSCGKNWLFNISSAACVLVKSLIFWVFPTTAPSLARSSNGPGGGQAVCFAAKALLKRLVQLHIFNAHSAAELARSAYSRLAGNRELLPTGGCDHERSAARRVGKESVCTGR